MFIIIIKYENRNFVNILIVLFRVISLAFQDLKKVKKPI